MRVIYFVILIPFFGADRELICARLADKLHQVAGIEAAVDELVGEIFEQRRIFRRVAGADVIERLDDADASEIAPKTIGVAGGEEPIVRRGDPGGELLAA